MEKQIDLYVRTPRQTTAEGVFASEDNVYDVKELGVKDVYFSRRCGLEIEDMMKRKWVFEKLRNLMMGIEGIISVLKRVFCLKRVAWKGVNRFASYVHSAIVSYNLTKFARLTL